MSVLYVLLTRRKNPTPVSFCKYGKEKSGKLTKKERKKEKLVKLFCDITNSCLVEQLVGSGWGGASLNHKISLPLSHILTHIHNKNYLRSYHHDQQQQHHHHYHHHQPNTSTITDCTTLKSCQYQSRSPGEADFICRVPATLATSTIAKIVLPVEANVAASVSTSHPANQPSRQTHMGPDICLPLKHLFLSLSSLTPSSLISSPLSSTRIKMYCTHALFPVIPCLFF